MRQRHAQFAPHARLKQVFETNEGEEPMDAVVRRFWSRTRTTTPNADAARFERGEHVTAPSTEVERAIGGVVVDLAQWMRDR